MTDLHWASQRSFYVLHHILTEATKERMLCAVVFDLRKELEYQAIDVEETTNSISSNR